uniref:Phage protein n=1 Tax=Panagrellus redivivus TaxID=6233 RepID=A0A7E4V328_PANRE
MPLYTVVIIENPESPHPFIQILPSLHQHADLTDAIKANGVPDALKSETTINFDAFEVKFVTVSPKNDKFLTVLANHPEVHSIFIVIETNNVDLRAADEQNLREMMAQIPKAAFPNCCIVNMFEESTVFKPRDAAFQCTDFLKKYCDNHGFASPCNHMIVSIKIWQAIVSPAKWMAISGARIDFIPREYCDDYADTKKGFTAFVDKIRHAQPLTAKNLEILACWRRLSELLYPRRTEDASKLLLSCLSENALTVVAAYARKRNLKGGKLDQADYQREVELWDVKDVKIATELRILCKLEHGVVIPKKTPPKPTVTAEIKPPEVKAIPKPPKKAIPNGSTLTVYITGPSDSDKLLLLTAINLVHLHKTFDDALKNGKEVKFDESNDHITDYGQHKIRFVAKESLTKLTGLDDDQVHGFIITVAKPDDNELRSSLGRLIRSKFENACIGCTFSRTADVEMKTINETMIATMAEIQAQHALTMAPRQFCIDKSLVQQILQHKADKNSTMEEKKSTWETMKSGINAFIESLHQLEPITQPDLRIADNWRALCDAFRPHARHRDPETLRLMATIADNCLTGLAIHCRKSKGDAQQFDDNELLVAVNLWKTKDAKVASALQTIFSK